MQLKDLTIDKINSIDFDTTSDNVGLYNHYYVQPPGMNHYRLLSYISSVLPSGSLVYEVGTLHGTSAYALAFNPEVTVISYDIVDNGIGLKQIPSNLQFRLGDVKNDRNILNADVIFIDTVHNGEWELDFYNWLVENEYHGITIWDDTHFHRFPEMETVFLHNVQHEIIELTHLGHASGTTAIIL